MVETIWQPSDISHFLLGLQPIPGLLTITDDMTTILVDTLCPVDPKMLRGQPVGTISGATLDRVKSALRLVFEL